MHESIARAVGTAGTAVVFAGCTVVVALVSLVVAGNPAGLVARLHGGGGGGNRGARRHHPASRVDGARRPAHQLRRPAGVAPSLREARQEGHLGNVGGLRRPSAVRADRRLPPLILVPLIIPTSDLQLGQEDIGQTPKSTMERQAYDLMAAGFGPGYNGPLLVAAAIHPAAKADPTVTAQENQLKTLQKELEAEQKQGEQMQSELEAGKAQLERQEATLERKEAALDAQADELRSEQASLEAEQAALEARAAKLQAKRDRLAAEARALAAQARRLAAQARLPSPQGAADRGVVSHRDEPSTDRAAGGPPRARPGGRAGDGCPSSSRWVDALAASSLRPARSRPRRRPSSSRSSRWRRRRRSSRPRERPSSDRAPSCRNREMHSNERPRRSKNRPTSSRRCRPRRRNSRNARNSFRAS